MVVEFGTEVTGQAAKDDQTLFPEGSSSLGSLNATSSTGYTSRGKAFYVKKSGRKYFDNR